MRNQSILQPLQLPQYSKLQTMSIMILRVFIGWHFLYEGFAKVFNPNWSAASFLLESQWIFSKVFIAMAENPIILSIVDWSNKIGLIAIGLGLIAGAFTSIACFGGIALLALYYLATPPFIGYTYAAPSEGSYMIINKNLIEAAGLFVLMMFPSGSIFGIDRFLMSTKAKASDLKDK